MSETSGRDPLEEVAESFLARLRRGERPALSEYVERYPELAGDIREFFQDLRRKDKGGEAGRLDPAGG